MKPPLVPLESAIVKAVYQHWLIARREHTLVGAIPNAGALGQPALTPGLADLLVMGPDLPGCPVGFIEQKRERKGARELRTPDQVTFAELCAILGVPYALAIGRDEPIDVLKKWRVIR